MFELPILKGLRISVPLSQCLLQTFSLEGQIWRSDCFISCHTVLPVSMSLVHWCCRRKKQYFYRIHTFRHQTHFENRERHAVQKAQLKISKQFHWPTLSNEFIASSSKRRWIIIFTKQSLVYHPFFLVKMLTVDILRHRLLFPVSLRLKTLFPTYRNITVLCIMSSVNVIKEFQFCCCSTQMRFCSY